MLKMMADIRLCSGHADEAFMHFHPMCSPIGILLESYTMIKREGRGPCFRLNVLPKCPLRRLYGVEVVSVAVPIDANEGSETPIYEAMLADYDNNTIESHPLCGGGIERFASVRELSWVKLLSQDRVQR